MKHMRRLFALALAVMLVMSLSIVVSATEDHTVYVYQIFSGTQDRDLESGNPDYTLGDVEWGSGIDSVAFLAALKTDERFVENGVNIFADCVTALDVAEVLSNYQNDSDVAKAFANVACDHRTTPFTIVTPTDRTVYLDAGYYLLMDAYSVEDVYNRAYPAVLQIKTNGRIPITGKADMPTVDKTIQNEGDAATSNLGETETFVITATMANNVSDFEVYKFVIHDTMSKGLTYLNDAVVTIDGVETNAFTVTATVNEDGTTTITAGCEDVKPLKVANSAVVVLTYSAKVNDDAKIGAEGNPNEVYLEFSNNPNWDGEGEVPTGKTPTDKVVIFTFELDVNKVNKDGEALEGAQFVLMNADETQVAKVNGGKFVKWVDLADVGVNEDGTYPDVYTLTSDANGEFAVSGLKDGTYMLKETKAPAGYNILKNSIKLVIAAEITDTEDVQSLDKLTIAVDNGEAVEGDAATGIVETDVENKAGVMLPTTGGMGTTLFYAIGGILMLAAVVLLVTKKRMASVQ